MLKKINLEFNGFWGNSIPESNCGFSGIYCVYVGTKQDNTNCSLRELIYIGESSNVSDRLANHEKLDAWKRQLEFGEILYFSVSQVSYLDREQAEAALIYKHKPICNSEYVDNFPYDTTSISLLGNVTNSLNSDFTVYKTW